MLISADAKYGMLTPVKYSHNNKHQKRVWEFKCDCGNTHLALLTEVKAGHTKSCGCYRVHLRHGMYATRIYQCWADMKTRCKNPASKQYKDYGGRGISVCDEWQVFEGFLKDMQIGYRDDLTIERVDNNKGYSKENCTWATRADQNRNQRRHYKTGRVLA